MPDQERCAETSAKRRHRLRYAHLSASHLGCVARNEVIHGLLRGESGDGRQDAEGIAGEKDNVGWMTSEARNFCVSNEVDGVGATRILRDACIVEINVMLPVFEHDILQHAAKSK